VSKGGRRSGAGRPPGARSRRTEELAAKVAETAERVTAALGIDAFDGDAHALLMSVYKDTEQPIDIRIDAAKAAIRYEKPALSNVEATGKDGGNLVVEIVRFSDTPS
jgi:hypothetical protein